MSGVRLEARARLPPISPRRPMTCARRFGPSARWSRSTSPSGRSSSRWGF